MREVDVFAATHKSFVDILEGIMMSRKECCAYCKHSIVPNEKQAHIIKCHRYPPILQSPYWSFPQVSPRGWCGEFVPMDELVFQDDNRCVDQYVDTSDITIGDLEFAPQTRVYKSIYDDLLVFPQGVVIDGQHYKLEFTVISEWDTKEPEPIMGGSPIGIIDEEAGSDDEREMLPELDVLELDRPNREVTPTSELSDEEVEQFESTHMDKKHNHLNDELKSNDLLTGDDDAS